MPTPGSQYPPRGRCPPPPPIEVPGVGVGRGAALSSLPNELLLPHLRPPRSTCAVPFPSVPIPRPSMLLEGGVVAPPPPPTKWGWLSVPRPLLSAPSLGKKRF